METVSNLERFYLYKKDIVDATIKSIKLNKNIILNITSGKNISVNYIISILKKLINFKFKIKKRNFHKSEYFYFKACNQLALKKLRWSPKVDIKTGIKLTFQA